MGWWAADRKPPFALLTYSAPAVHRGGTLQVDAQVLRDLNRRCSVEFSRYIFDSRGFRYDLNARQVMTADAVKRLDEATPGSLRLIVPVPEQMSPGRARFQTALEYACDFNPLHQLWPIEVLMEIQFEVKP